MAALISCVWEQGLEDHGAQHVACGFVDVWVPLLWQNLVNPVQRMMNKSDWWAWILSVGWFTRAQVYLIMTKMSLSTQGRLVCISKKTLRALREDCLLSMQFRALMLEDLQVKYTISALHSYWTGYTHTHTHKNRERERERETHTHTQKHTNKQKK